MEYVRLQKFLAESGIASRRKAEELIRQGRVSVNGSIAASMGMKVSAEDIVELDGRKIAPERRKVYIMLNKPPGYVSTVKDQFSRKTVLDLVKGVKERIYPVGRLDYGTSGLLLLTNDGGFAHRMTHPGHEVEKTYVAEVKGRISKDAVEMLKEGIEIDGYISLPAKVKVVKVHQDNSIVEISIREGKNRQVRKMFEAAGYTVAKLKRTGIGSLKLGGLPEGKWRFLRKDEIDMLSHKA